MLRRTAFLTLFSCLLLTLSSLAQCSKDHRDSKTGGIFIKDFTITGTQNLTSTELARITGELTGDCFNDDSEEMDERIRASFQDRGYFAVEVKSVRFKPLDPLGVPKPVVMEAEVSEGPRCSLVAISFGGNHAFTAEQLREAFPLKLGAIFEREKVATGLENLRKLYGKAGYIDFVPIPETQFRSKGTVSLNITVEEGPQYHMGKLEIVAQKELAARLLGQWKLREGEPYDMSYIDRYIDANRNLLPAAFTRADFASKYDCPNALVHLWLIIDPDLESKKPWLPPVVLPCDDRNNQK